jgi:hypothetical protein
MIVVHKDLKLNVYENLHKIIKKTKKYLKLQKKMSIIKRIKRIKSKK